MDEFRKVKGSDIYAVNRAGEVINTCSGKILKPYKRDDRKRPYMCVDLTIHGKRRTTYIHRLVAIAFIPNPLYKLQVNHIDSNKQNNNVSNLEWTTCQENMDHRNHRGKYA